MTANSDLPLVARATLKELRDSLRAGEISAREVAESQMARIEAHRDHNIFITETADHALAQAAESDKRLKAGNPRPLEGVTIALKDNYCTHGIETTAASRILKGFVPAYESTVSQRVQDAGAILVGKANLDEFAMGSSTENSHFGPTINPAGRKNGFDNLAPGGSSGGSAAAVASFCAAGALGTDTGGSVRQPASFCGVVGMKPSYGFCSRYGIVAFGSSLDQAGAFGRTVEDVALLLEVMIGHDPKDSTSAPDAKLDVTSSWDRPLGKKRIGLPKELRSQGSTAETEKVWQRAEKLAADLGADLVEVSLPSIAYALPVYYIIALSEASSNLARYDGVRYGHRAAKFEDINDMYCQTRAEGFGAEVKRRILTGTFSLSSGYYDQYYDRALRVRRLIANEFRAAFADVDVMIAPTTPSGAFAIGSHSADPVQMYLEDVYTVPVNLAGLPAISLPIAADERGMPLGLQVIGPQFGDETVLRTAAAFEQAAAF